MDIHNMLFADFKQAFDKVNRYQLKNTMKEFNIPPKLRRMTKEPR